MKMKSIFVCLVSAVCLQTAFGGDLWETERNLLAQISARAAELKEQELADQVIAVYGLPHDSLSRQLLSEALWSKHKQIDLIVSKEQADLSFFQQARDGVINLDTCFIAYFLRRENETVFYFRLQTFLCFNPSIKTLDLNLKWQKSEWNNNLLKVIAHLLTQNKTLESVFLFINLAKDPVLEQEQLSSLYSIAKNSKKINRLAIHLHNCTVSKDDFRQGLEGASIPEIHVLSGKYLDGIYHWELSIQPDRG